MPARTLRRFSLLIAVSGVLSAALGAGTASATIPWAACPTAGFECAGLGVPLDRTGAVGGTIDLSVQRVPAATNPNRVAVVPLARARRHCRSPRPSRRCCSPRSPTATC